MPKRYFLALLILAASSVLPAQSIVDAIFLESRSREELAMEYGFFIRYGIDMYKVFYTTPGVQGQPDTASGLLVIPRARDYALPLFIYQHGSSNSKEDTPSSLNIVDHEVPLAFAGAGFVALAPDYLGLGESRGFHPYLHAATEASAAIDMLRAAEPYVQEQGQVLNGQLFLAGYSQGGHASMALHRALQQDFSGQYEVTAAAHLSGPYSLANIMRDFILSEEEYFSPGYIARIVLGLNEYYRIYDDFGQVFRQPYLGPVLSFYDDEITLGKLHDTLSTLLIQEVGLSQPKYIFQDSLRQHIADDPGHPLNVALMENDVYNWAPLAPTRLYYCMADEQVLYTNSLLADSVMNANGAPDVRSIDVDSNLGHSGCAEPALTLALLFFGQYVDIVMDAGTVAGRQSARLYPNPTSGPVTITGLPSGARIGLYSADGRLILRTAYRPGAFTVHGLPPGLYLLKWNEGPRAVVEKVIVE